MWGREQSDISLLAAAQRGNLPQVCALLEGDSSNCLIDQTDHMGYGASHWAAYYDEVIVFTKLVEMYPRALTAKTKRGLTPLHIACTCGSIRIASWICSAPNDAADKDDNAGAQNKGKIPSSASAPLSLSDEKLAGLLNATNCFGETPLHLAAGIGKEQLVRILLDARPVGADPLCRDKWGRTARKVRKENLMMRTVRY